jgi:hypothetical protein
MLLRRRRSRVGEYDEIVAESAEQQADRAEQRKLAAVRVQGRDAAILRGRLYGEQTADEKGERGLLREERVRRAMAYAAWEFDGKPSGGAHLREFGLAAGEQPADGKVGSRSEAVAPPVARKASDEKSATSRSAPAASPDVRTDWKGKH